MGTFSFIIPLEYSGEFKKWYGRCNIVSYKKKPTLGEIAWRLIFKGIDMPEYCVFFHLLGIEEKLQPGLPKDKIILAYALLSFVGESGDLQYWKAKARRVFPRLRSWINPETGRTLLEHINLELQLPDKNVNEPDILYDTFIPKSKPRYPQRKRGYNDKGSAPSLRAGTELKSNLYADSAFWSEVLVNSIHVSPFLFDLSFIKRWIRERYSDFSEIVNRN